MAEVTIKTKDAEVTVKCDNESAEKCKEIAERAHKEGCQESVLG